MYEATAPYKLYFCAKFGTNVGLYGIEMSVNKMHVEHDADFGRMHGYGHGKSLLRTCFTRQEDSFGV